MANSPESLERYTKLCEQIRKGTPPALVIAGPDPTVADILVASWGHAQVHYLRPDGIPVPGSVEVRVEGDGN